MEKKLVIATGGTGGHLFPALVLAEEARCSGFSVKVSLGDLRLPLDLSDFEVVVVKSGPLAGRGIRGGLGLLKLGVGTLQSIRHILGWGKKNLCVLGTGSYASAPVLLSARLLGVPYFLIEQNSVPGRVIRRFAGGANAVFLTFPGAKEHLEGAETLWTGNPIRTLKRIDRKEARERLGFSRDRPLLFCIGGSQGSRILAQAACEVATGFKDLQFLIQSGAQNHPGLVAEFGESGENYRLVPFIEDMSLPYSAADFALSRAGGGAIAEMAALGVPPILVPLATASDQHQLENAKALVSTDAALLIEEKDLNPESLSEEISSLLENPELLESLRDNLSAFAKPDAASSIIKALNALEP
jgi:UDP-N-acetylglucosamine--N-acetylmuramyl-(pentapeptide) pyrophosphoryl-undecaprenol N-acetylglucosamine transferase